MQAKVKAYLKSLRTRGSVGVLADACSRHCPQNLRMDHMFFFNATSAIGTVAGCTAWDCNFRVDHGCSNLGFQHRSWLHRSSVVRFGESIPVDPTVLYDHTGRAHVCHAGVHGRLSWPKELAEARTANQIGENALERITSGLEKHMCTKRLTTRIWNHMLSMAPQSFL